MAFAADYIEVAERIAEWYRRWPQGRITCEVVELTDSRVTVRAAAYRTQDPAEPPSGVGHSYLAIPGTTPFTHGAELENAETSAAGRALVMAGIPAKSVASAHEIRTKEASRPSPKRAAGKDGGQRDGSQDPASGMGKVEAGDCDHSDGLSSTLTNLKPDGITELPRAHLRCTACGQVRRAEAWQ
jgi:hypothetical protein